MTTKGMIQMKQDMLKNILQMMCAVRTKEDLDILRNAWRSLNEIDHIIIRHMEHERSGAYVGRNEAVPYNLRGFQELRGEEHGHIRQNLR